SSNAVWTTQASGRIDGNLVLQNTTAGFVVNGGSQVFPATVLISGNRANQNAISGLGLGGAGETEDDATGPGRRTLDLEANKFTRVASPAFDRSVNPEDIPDTLNAVVVGNDFNGHGFSAIRCVGYFAFAYQTAVSTQEETAHVHARFANNVARMNTRYGVMVDAGFPGKANPRKWTATIDLAFEGNTLSDNGWAPALFDFWRAQESVAEALARAAGQPFDFSTRNFRYLQDSTYTVTGDLSDFDYDNRALDPTIGNV